MASRVPAIAVRGSNGISVGYGPPNYDTVANFKKDDSKACKCLIFSASGEYLAWANGKTVTVVNTKDWNVVTEIDKPKTLALQFSPNDTFLVTWEVSITTKEHPNGTPNMNIYRTKTGELVQSFVQKQSSWQPEWTVDETLMARLYKNDILFYSTSDFETIENRMANQRVHTFSVSPGPPPLFVLAYIPGKQGQPSLGKLYQYPKFDTSITGKSFFQADSVEMIWNKKATGVLLMTIVEVDKTGSSYYGKQTLNYMSVKGDSAMVQLGKEGPIYSVKWSPNSQEFCVIYGLMPAKATIYNTKCEVVLDLGTGPKNSVYYNPQGNILLLGGFGNLPGPVEVWDVNSKKIIAKATCPDTTLLEWSPDGVHFMTATTAPRLRVCNGFKMWHYSGALLYERPWNQQEELWQVAWQTFPEGVFPAPVISYKPVEGIAPSVPQASKQVYKPPVLRGKVFNLHDDDDSSSAAAVDPVSGQSLSKSALKQKKKREAKKAAKAKAAAEERDSADETPTAAPVATTTKATNGQVKSHYDEFTSSDPAKMKKILRLKSKVMEIRRLKEQQRSGQQLEINQLEKIKKEEQLVQEMRELAL